MKDSSQQPFWNDEPDLVTGIPFGAQFERRWASFLRVVFTIMRFFIFIVILYFLAAMFASLTDAKYVGWLVACIFILPMLFGIILGVFRQRRNKLLIAEIRSIQQHAREITGASVIGSAIHVAGHPLLSREQRVVIALRGDLLSFYSYENSDPIHSLPVKDVESIHTVVYDDDRVPHIEVIDNTAQALQLSFALNNSVYDCLFRRLRDVRAIDWYHAIQKARLGSDF